MTWLVWRQHRGQLSIATAALAAFAALMLITGLQMASQYHSALTSCAATNSCGDLAGTLSSLGGGMAGFLVTLTMAVPAVLGMFWGAPIVARELETGTGNFLWTQSVTCRRWFTVKTGWMLLAAAVWGGAVSALVTWWFRPVNALHLSKFVTGKFDIQGIVPVGYALFAMALGLAAGTVLRRSLPALAVTLGAFTGLRIVIAGWARPHYMSAVTSTYSLISGYTPAGSYLQVAQGSIAPDGKMLPGQGFGLSGDALQALCKSVAGSGPSVSVNSLASCLSAHGYRGFITYQPASRFWAFQGIETGIFVALAAALTGVAAFVLLRRDA